MTFTEFHKRYERDGDLERRRFDSMAVDELLPLIRANHLGENFQIWYSLGARASAPRANATLLAFLSSDAEYLQRYHCAAALIRINHLTTWQPAQLSAGPKDRLAGNLAAVRNRVGG